MSWKLGFDGSFSLKSAYGFNAKVDPKGRWRVPFFLEPNIWSSAGFALAEQKQGFGSNIWSNETLLAQLSHMNMPWNANKKLQDLLPDVSVRSQGVFTWIITEGGNIIVNCDGVVSHSTRKVV